MVNNLSIYELKCQIAFLFLTHIIFVVFGQITQQVFMAEEWVHDARKEANAKSLSCADVEKSLGALKQEQAELSEMLKEAV